ncbi:MAG: hypothetical protein ACK4Y7_05690, partial [Caldimicrobium sp.]
ISPNSKDFLEKLFTTPFSLYLRKRSASHLFFNLTFHNEKTPSLCLKLYTKRIFKKNRVKNYLKNYRHLEKLKVPTLFPLFIFYQSLIKSLFSKNSFLGGIVIPFISQGFLSEEEFRKDYRGNKLLLQELLYFLYTLHEKGIFLRDTKYSNFYYSKEEGFKIFDLDGISFYKRKLNLRERLKDLAPLAMTLEWIGLSQVDLFLFKSYQNFYSPMKDDLIFYFKDLIKNKRQKRLKKLKVIPYRGGNTFFP